MKGVRLFKVLVWIILAFLVGFHFGSAMDQRVYIPFPVFQHPPNFTTADVPVEVRI